ncbi:Calcineurin-like phosphoesterase superfamily protein [Paramicrobacterium humi]|uniref:Calcineurin-like phosphoesterase superfamily protein n=1 Tax=Paramicrobacterium humi TaxID=640635 RepID=A0A1H4KK75_9MICO|nr:metallophosphoesterase family protein [Microbacterium humi]SEB58954.1 Calcineurin-like phosphoesterase superfamily protein [Microbacterium humi]
MTTWWTADTHFSHVNIIRYTHRPFADVDEMNRELIARWNDRVAPDDDVWHLGDLALGHPIEDQIAMTAQLNGRRRLVPGNHDRVATFFEGGDQRAKYWRVYEDAGWQIMPERLEHSIEGRRVLVCHFPYRGDSLAKDRYRAERPLDHGLPILHGHVHTEFAERGRQFNVGVDVRDYAPVDERAIVDWLRSLD